MFESFLANKYTAAKRFGLEGCEALVPGMKVGWPGRGLGLFVCTGLRRAGLRRTPRTPRTRPVPVPPTHPLPEPACGLTNPCKHRP